MNRESIPKSCFCSLL